MRAAIYQNHADKYKAWTKYKPLSPETIERFEFGYGYLPGAIRNHWWTNAGIRLIVPLRATDGKIYGFAGRSIDGSEPKWLVPKGTKRILWNLRNVYKGCVVWVVENYVDAALIMQEAAKENQPWVAVATGMARALRPREVRYMKDKGVALVVVAMDNDLAGQVRGEQREELRRKWKEEKGFDAPREGAGDKSMRVLRRYGMYAWQMDWTGTDAKMDIGNAIENHYVILGDNPDEENYNRPTFCYTGRPEYQAVASG